MKSNQPLDFSALLKDSRLTSWKPPESVSQGVIRLSRSFLALWVLKENCLRPVSELFVIVLWSVISPWTTVNRSPDTELTKQQKAAHLLWLCLCAKITITVIKPVSVRGGSSDYCCQLFNRQLNVNRRLVCIANKLLCNNFAGHLPKIIGTLLLSSQKVKILLVTFQ